MRHCNSASDNGRGSESKSELLSGKRFQPDRDIPDLSGKVIFVTGGNTGLGKETILELSKHRPAQIFLAARSEDKANAAIHEIREAVPYAAPMTFIELDLGSFESIKRAANTFLSQSAQLHLLINNAGIMACPPGLTKDGYEIQFGTNHMGHALLTKLLLPTLQNTAQTGQDVRIVTVSSGLEDSAPETWDFSQLKTDMSSATTFTRYGISKISNIYHSRALSRRYPDIRCVSIHPGVVNTDLGRGIEASYPMFAPLHKVLRPVLSKSPASGAKNQLWASVSPTAKSGEFYHPIGVAGKGSRQSQDTDLENQLWYWTEKELEGHYL